MKKGKKIFHGLIIIISAVLITSALSSCSYSQSCYNNLKGIYASENGSFGKALISFKKALSGSSRNSEYIYYNISRIYRDMGEPEAASGILSGITGNADKGLEYRINYLKGIIAYNEGEYEDAVLFFKNSVKINNSDINLIKGLELAYFQINNKKAGRKEIISKQRRITENMENKSGPEGPPHESDNGKSDTAAVGSGELPGGKVLDYMFKEEVRLWLGDGDTDPENTPDW